MNSSHEILHDLSNRRFVRLHSMKIKRVACLKTNYHKRKKSLSFPCCRTEEWEEETKNQNRHEWIAYACERNFFTSKSTNCPENIVFGFAVLNKKQHEKRMTCSKWIAGKTSWPKALCAKCVVFFALSVCFAEWNRIDILIVLTFIVRGQCVVFV